MQYKVSFDLNFVMFSYIYEMSLSIIIKTIQVKSNMTTNYDYTGIFLIMLNKYIGIYL